jgi:hypothetical protein
MSHLALFCAFAEAAKWNLLIMTYHFLQPKQTVRYFRLLCVATVEIHVCVALIPVDSSRHPLPNGNRRKHCFPPKMNLSSTESHCYLPVPANKRRPPESTRPKSQQQQQQQKRLSATISLQVTRINRELETSIFWRFVLFPL